MICLIFNFHLKNKKRPTNTLLMMMKVAGFGVGEGEDAVFLPSNKAQRPTMRPQAYPHIEK